MIIMYRENSYNSEILLVTGASGDKVEDLLIDWTEENDTRSKPWDDNLREFEDSEPKASNWIQFDESDMNTQFER